MADLKTLQDKALTNPDLLGKMLIDGCGGNASTIKGICEQFQGNYSQLNDMLTTGCGGSGDKLVSIMRDTCDGEAEDLKELCDAFPGVDMDKFKNLEKELGEKSSEKLRRLWTNEKLGQNAKGLKKLYDELDGFAPNATRRGELIGIAGSLEFEKIDVDKLYAAAKTDKGKKARLGHASTRHLMKCSNLSKPKPPANTTTLWPEGTDEPALARYLDEALNKLTHPSKKDDFGKEGTFAQRSTTVGNGIRVVVGFKRKGNDVEVSQFYPSSGSTLKSLSNLETDKLKALLVKS
jgi:hypothetical protein